MAMLVYRSVYSQNSLIYLPDLLKASGASVVLAVAPSVVGNMPLNLAQWSKGCQFRMPSKIVVTRFTRAAPSTQLIAGTAGNKVKHSYPAEEV